MRIFNLIVYLFALIKLLITVFITLLKNNNFNTFVWIDNLYEIIT